MPSDWLFALLLFAGMSLAAWFTVQQQHAYQKELNRILAESTGEHLVMVSGRARSFRGGAITILVVDAPNRQIVRASAMSGVTIFARFHELAEPVGPVEGAVTRVRKKRLRDAITMALAQVTQPTDKTVLAPRTSAEDRSKIPKVITGRRSRRVTPRGSRSVSGADRVRPDPPPIPNPQSSERTV